MKSFCVFLPFLRCIVKNPDTMFVEWFKDGRPMIDYTDLSYRTTVDRDGSMIISPTIMSDLGEYQCKVRSSSGDEQRVNAFLNVQCES